jgi:hypothetical protein
MIYHDILILDATSNSPSVPSDIQFWLSSEASALIAAACNVVAHIGCEAAVAGTQQGDPKETCENWRRRENLAVRMG